MEELLLSVIECTWR